MKPSPEILAIAQRRVAALLPDSLHGDTTAAYARRDQLRIDLVARGTSAVAAQELRLLEEALDAIDFEMQEEAKAEIWAEGAAVRYAEMPTADDLAFEQYEARMGLRQPEDDMPADTEDIEHDCLGHPADHNGLMGETTYCDGSCRRYSR